MSSLSGTVSCSDEKLSASVKYPLRKVNDGGLNSAPIILLTVEYSQNGKQPHCSSKSIEGGASEEVGMDRSESLPYSLLNLGGSIVKDISYNDVSETIHIEDNKTNSNYNPVIVLRNEDEDDDSDDAFHKESYSESMLNNFLFTPLPKSVVCTVMPKDMKEEKSPISQEVISECFMIGNNEINDAGKFSDCDGYSSGEETVHVISDKPVMCRALASLPVSFLYFGKTASKTDSSKGVFAKREIPRKAQFGPMEGVLCDYDSNLEYHHLELSIDCSNGSFERLDVSNENTANWMRYVRHAECLDEQNLCLNQIGKNLYFTACRKIDPREELKAWYSRAYAKTRNLPLLGNEITLYKSEVIKIESFRDNENVYEPENCDIKEPSNKWTCSHCQRIFRSPALFNLHVLTHAADNLEINENCDRLPSISKDKSIIGSSRFRNKKHFVCNQCSKVFSNNSTLSSHLRSHASEKVFDCPICKQTFYKVRYFKEHIGTHSVGGKFFCPHCSKEYQQYKHIRNHIRKFHSGKRFKCVECPKQFSTLDKLKIHLHSHSDSRDFTCSKCGKKFKRKDKLATHTRRKHQLCSEKQPPVNTSVNLEKKTRAKYDEYIYKCHICILGFKRRGMLVNHLAQKHPSLTPSSVPELNLPILKANVDYYCLYCDKTYKSSSKRKAHILKNHPGEKLPLSRQLVSKASTSKNETYSQTIGSVTTNPQSCEWCHKQYASRSKLRGHQRKKHPHLLPKDFLLPKPSGKSNQDTERKDSIKEVDEKVHDAEMFLQDPLELSEYEFSVGESKVFGDGEFIVDANTLKRVLKGELLPTDCSPETLAELGQIIEARPDGYFKVFQGPSGITLAHPIEVWDPLSICLGPPEPNSMLPST